MNTVAMPSTRTFTFVVRFWREISADEVRWRGRLEHVESQKRSEFLDVNGLLDALCAFDIDGSAPIPCEQDSAQA